MKIPATASLLAATALAFAPQPAKAGDEVAAAIGGFIGGLVIGSVLDYDHDDRFDRYDHHVGTTVVIGTGHRHPHRAGGYWKTVTVRHWVPGYWAHSCDRYGRPVRVFVEGRWEYRTDRVWVSYGRPDRHGRHGRRHGHGYGYDDNDHCR